jgi:hypothetical protein
MAVQPMIYVLENLLGYDGRTHHFEKGYWLKFEFKRVPETSQRPHGWIIP